MQLRSTRRRARDMGPRSPVRVLVPILLVGFSLVGRVGVARARAVPSHPGPCGPWTASITPRAMGAGVLAISGLSSTDVWAVGSESSNLPVVMHWDGTSWTKVPQALFDSTLYGVADNGPSDVWAVGGFRS